MLIGRDKYYKILYFKINITGRRGSDYESDIALDDFKIYKEHCSKYNYSYCSVYNHICGFKLSFLFKWYTSFSLIIFVILQLCMNLKLDREISSISSTKILYI